MGLFSRNKEELLTLADNEFKFSMSFFKYIINNNTFVVRLMNKKGKMTSEESYSMKQIEKIEHKLVGGNRYRIEVKLANEKKAASTRTIDYNREKEGVQADKFISMLNDRIN
ncbi:hypothetical protein [Carnobacterium pleistocenium]|uniref:hypothetical protein n=1 Tax=Carnobacterium pleistocenium TaxID=181073 RepID=UPI00054DA639|nr:hypothetical protein [Carnobacterium pleistocenium]